MNDDTYRETALQRTARLKWAPFVVDHPKWNAVMCVAQGLIAALCIVAGIAFSDPVIVATGMVATLPILVGLLLHHYARKAQDRFEVHEAQMEMIRYRQDMERQKLTLPTDPNMSEEEFHQALIALLTELHRSDGGTKLEGLITETVQLAYSDMDTFEEELKRARLAREYK